MLVKPISAVPSTDSVDTEWLRTLVTSVLDYGELASALTASDLPTKRVEITADERIAFAVQGLVRLGVDAVREHAERGRTVNLRMVELMDLSGGRYPAGSPLGQALDHANRELWGSFRRKQRAHDVAARIHGQRPDSPFNFASIRRPATTTARTA